MTDNRSWILICFGFRLLTPFTPFTPPGAFTMQRPLSRRLIRFANFAFLFAAVLAISSHAGVLQLFGNIVEYIAPDRLAATADRPARHGRRPAVGRHRALRRQGHVGLQRRSKTGRSRTAAPSPPSTTSRPSRPSATARSTSNGPTPEKVEGSGQGRGNSGVFMMGQYEIQVLDSYDNDTYYDGQCRRGLQAAPAHGQRLPQAGRVADLRHHLECPQVRPAGQAPQTGLRDRAAQRRAWCRTTSS